MRTKEYFDVPKSDMPNNAVHSSILKIENGNYIIDYEAKRKFVENFKSITEK